MNKQHKHDLKMFISIFTVTLCTALFTAINLTTFAASGKIVDTKGNTLSTGTLSTVTKDIPEGTNDPIDVDNFKSRIESVASKKNNVTAPKVGEIGSIDIPENSKDPIDKDTSGSMDTVTGANTIAGAAVSKDIPENSKDIADTDASGSSSIGKNTNNAVGNKSSKDSSTKLVELLGVLLTSILAILKTITKGTV